jgi:TIM-barrel protein
MKMVKFRNRLVLSAMAGINDHKFCSKFPAGMVILGGFSVDEESMEASKKAVKRGRREFIFEDPLKGVKTEIEGLIKAYDGVFAVNVRSASEKGYLKTAKLVSEYGGIIEINAHCRQPEFVEIGCGQELLKERPRLISIVKKTSKICPTCVKIRGGLPLDYCELTRELKEAGCLMLHVDAMILGGNADFELINEVSKEILTIGNNSVIDVYSAKKMLESGAKLVSAARAVLRDEKFFEKLLKDSLLSSPLEIRVD